ncbi:sugar-binding transcriptional regulator [Aerococcus urinaeequi]|uniref:sugar-binding transcriptional regulator n=1 Tax=Aerococcus urinaeequi TaxID=51665 RepID=UPI0008460CA5|nr:sugar-binding transcriptional regulator [Aerococcus urinaeequi]
MKNERRLIVKIAEMYYKEELTQNQIAKQLNISRIRVSRLLKKAIESSIVTININYSGLFSDLENELIDKYNLKDIIIVDANESDYVVKIAEAAGNYLNQYILEGEIITVGWGKTLKTMVNYCAGEFTEQTVFTPIIGGHNPDYFTLHSNYISSELATKYKSKSLSILAPAIASSIDKKNLYTSEDYVKDVLDTSKKATKAIFSLGSPQYDESTLIESGYFNKNELEQIREKRAVCDIASIVFLDENSNIILNEFTDRSIGLTVNDLRAIPNKICVAGGQYKHLSIHAALNAQLIDTLITDIDTADFLLKV